MHVDVVELYLPERRKGPRGHRDSHGGVVDLLPLEESHAQGHRRDLHTMRVELCIERLLDPTKHTFKQKIQKCC